MADMTYSTVAGHTTQEHSKPGLPQLDAETFPSQLFWLTVTFLLLYMLFARLVLPCIREVLEKRQHHITQELDRAESMSQEADEARQDYETLQSDARGKAQQFIADAQATIAAMQEKKFSEVDADLAEKLSKARADIEKKRASVRESLIPVARDVSTQIVKKLTDVTPSAKQLDKKLLAE